MRKREDESWGRFIKRTQSSEKYHEFRKNYLKVWRFQRKTGFNLDVNMEAANYTIYGHSALFDVIDQTHGVTDKRTLMKKMIDRRLGHFMEHYGDIKIPERDSRGEPIYNKRHKPKYTTINEQYEKLLNGEITQSTFNSYIPAVKKSIDYYVSHS